MTSGLIIFLIVIGVNIPVLVFDAYLKWWAKKPTISRRVWSHPIWGWVLIGWQLFGAMGLAYHLWIPPSS